MSLKSYLREYGKQSARQAFPSTSNAIEIWQTSTYTAPEDGWLYVQTCVNAQYLQIQSNVRGIILAVTSDTVWGCQTVAVVSGETIEVLAKGATTGAYDTNLKFFPCRAAA